MDAHGWMGGWTWGAGMGEPQAQAGVANACGSASPPPQNATRTHSPVLRVVHIDSHDHGALHLQRALQGGQELGAVLHLEACRAQHVRNRAGLNTGSTREEQSRGWQRRFAQGGQGSATGPTRWARRGGAAPPSHPSQLGALPAC